MHSNFTTVSGAREMLRAKCASVVALALLAALTACASRAPQVFAAARPSESLLEVVSVLRRHVPDDTYRFAPARDFTGRNVYRASLLRLENMERAFAANLRAGAWAEVIPFSKGRALERLRAFDLAGGAFRNAARYEGALRATALESAALCDAFAKALALAPQPRAADGGAAAFKMLDARAAKLDELAPAAAGTHYEIILREEREHLDVARAGLLRDLRRVLPNGDVNALAALQRNVIAHRESKFANRHLLRLADLYGALAREYIEQNPPESLTFDPARFEELVENAVRLYESVSNQDGATEKLEAGRKLEAFLAFTLRVDRDRFSP